MALWNQTTADETNEHTTAAFPPLPAQATSIPVTREGIVKTSRESVFGSGVTIEGRIEGESDIRIGGTFKGDIQIKGDVNIEKGARLSAKVNAANVILGGELEGNVVASGQVKLLETIDQYARSKDERVRQVSASIAGTYKEVEILRADGTFVRDVRPLVRVNVSIVVGDGDRQESGSHGTGGREGFGQFLAEDSWHHTVDEALRQALVNLTAIPAPAGTFDVVLGPMADLHPDRSRSARRDGVREGNCRCPPRPACLRRLARRSRARWRCGVRA